MDAVQGCLTVTPRQVVMLARLRILVLAALVQAIACTPSYVVVPAKGGAVGEAKQERFVLEAAPNAWREHPIDLDLYVTPILVRVVNRSGQDIRVAYTDLALTNEAGFRFVAISPYPFRTDVLDISASTDTLSRRTDRAITSNGTHEGEGTAARQPPSTPVDDTGGQLEWTSPSNGPIRGQNCNLGYGSGFPMRPYYRGINGHYAPWPYFDFGPHYYGPHVQYWGDRRHPLGPTPAVLSRGLPEGVLRAGDHVEGFVYFRRAANRPTTLDLRWTPHDTSGRRLAVLRVPLKVVES